MPTEVSDRFETLLESGETVLCGPSNLLFNGGAVIRDSVKSVCTKFMHFARYDIDMV